MGKTVIIGSLMLAACLAAALFFVSQPSGALRSKVKDLKEFQLFNDWQVKWSKFYEDEDEMMMRFGIWYNSYQIVEAQNNKVEKNYTFALYPFSDLTKEEFLSQYACNFLDLPNDIEQMPHPGLEALEAPSSCDWGNSGAVTPVQNQGSCGSCWAFAAVAALEGAYKQSMGSLIKFSETQQVDCQANYGCNGGWYETSFSWWKGYGPVLLSDYPYRAYQSSCQKTARQYSKLRGYTRYYPGENNLKTNAGAGVLAVAIDCYPVYYYKSGVFDGTCSGASINHAVTLTGYGNCSRGGDFWKFKNSWGTWWGESGYCRLRRTYNDYYGKCGIALYGSRPYY